MWHVCVQLKRKHFHSDPLDPVVEPNQKRRIRPLFKTSESANSDGIWQTPVGPHGAERTGEIPACGCQALMSVSESGQQNTHKWPAGGHFGSGKLQNQPRTRQKEWGEIVLQNCLRCYSVQLAGWIIPEVQLSWNDPRHCFKHLHLLKKKKKNIFQIFSDITSFDSCFLMRNTTFMWIKKKPFSSIFSCAYVWLRPRVLMCCFKE